MLATPELKGFVDSAEERGLIAEDALEALAYEHELDEDEVAAVRAELEERGVEITREEEKVHPVTPSPSSRSRATR